MAGRGVKRVVGWGLVMYIDCSDITIEQARPMPIQIANPVVVAKIKALAARSGLTKTAAVERAVDAMLTGRPADDHASLRARMTAILAQLDRIPDLPEAQDPLDWDEIGLPR